MGNNAAFSIFEDVVIAVYDKGVLDKELLSSIMTAVASHGGDVDSGGFQGTLSNDGLDVYSITLKTFGNEVPVYPELPKDHTSWTDEQDMANEEYHETLHGSFNAITEQFGWR